MALYLALDQDKWYRNNYSDSDLLTGTIYTDIQQVTPKNLTGYTITIRMHRGRSWGDRFGKAATIVTAADGTWSYATTEGEIPPPGIYKVVCELTNATEKISTLNRQELLVIQGPSS